MNFRKQSNHGGPSGTNQVIAFLCAIVPLSKLLCQLASASDVGSSLETLAAAMDDSSFLSVPALHLASAELQNISVPQLDSIEIPDPKLDAFLSTVFSNPEIHDGIFDRLFDGGESGGEFKLDPKQLIKAFERLSNEVTSNHSDGFAAVGDFHTKHLPSHDNLEYIFSQANSDPHSEFSSLKTLILDSMKKMKLPFPNVWEEAPNDSVSLENDQNSTPDILLENISPEDIEKVGRKNTFTETFDNLSDSVLFLNQDQQKTTEPKISLDAIKLALPQLKNAILESMRNLKLPFPNIWEDVTGTDTLKEKKNLRYEVSKNTLSQNKSLLDPAADDSEVSDVDPLIKTEFPLLNNAILETMKEMKLPFPNIWDYPTVESEKTHQADVLPFEKLAEIFKALLKSSGNVVEEGEPPVPSIYKPYSSLYGEDEFYTVGPSEYPSANQSMLPLQLMQKQKEATTAENFDTDHYDYGQDIEDNQGFSFPYNILAPFSQGTNSSLGPVSLPVRVTARLPTGTIHCEFSIFGSFSLNPCSIMPHSDMDFEDPMTRSQSILQDAFLRIEVGGRQSYWKYEPLVPGAAGSAGADQSGTWEDLDVDEDNEDTSDDENAVQPTEDVPATQSETPLQAASSTNTEEPGEAKTDSSQQFQFVEPPEEVETPSQTVSPASTDETEDVGKKPVIWMTTPGGDANISSVEGNGSQGSLSPQGLNAALPPPAQTPGDSIAIPSSIVNLGNQ